MFGIYRLILAILVMVTHIGGVEVYAGLAVWGFFMLSGFLITGVLNRRYSFSKSGLIEFAWSRALRLYPTYWLSLIITWLTFKILPGHVDPLALNESLAMPNTWPDQLAGVFIIGNTFLGLGRPELALSPSAWAIDVEITLYLLAAVWVSKRAINAWRTVVVCMGLFPLCWFAGKWLVRSGHLEIAGQLSYSFIIAALLPFSVGAALWHYRHVFSKIRASRVRLVLAGIMLVGCASFVNQISVTLAYLVSLPILAIVTSMLAGIKTQRRFRQIDSFLGNMSYPVYLIHWTCGLIIVDLFAKIENNGVYQFSESGIILFSIVGFCLVTTITIILSALIAAVFEEPIERHRRTLQTAQSAQARRAAR